MKRSRQTKAGEAADFMFGLTRVAPIHLVANPFPGREHEYAAPQLEWLQIERRVEISATAEALASHGGDVSPAELKRAADFLWVLECSLEKPQLSVLHVRKPFPPRLSRYLLRARRSGVAVHECFGSKA